MPRPAAEPASGASPAGPAESRRPRRARSMIGRITRGILALFIFVGALQVMKTGAANLSILNAGTFVVENAASTLGLGWLGALLVLSGSPIAATSLTLVAAGEQVAPGEQRFTEIQGFTMLTGSRLGAAFVVLVTAVVYALRAGEGGRKAPVSAALIALVATAVVYLPAAVIGLVLLSTEPFGSLDLRFPAQWFDVIDFMYGGIVSRVEDRPAGLVFLGGFVLLLVAFKIIDSTLPQLDESAVPSRRREWLRRKWPMFGIGSVVALVTMSVSIALTFLVPLVAKNYVRHHHIVPYIMGANITTLGDTMLAAFALNSPGAVRIVLAEVLATSLVSVLLLAFLYDRLWHKIWDFQQIFATSPRRLAIFTAALFALPTATIVIAGTVT